MKNINEGRGISEINKKVTENIFELFIKNGYGEIPYKFYDKDILIKFEENTNYNSYFYKNNRIFILYFSIPKQYNTSKVKEIITHELNHFIEIYNIEKKGFKYPKYNNIKKALIKFNPTSIPLSSFKHLIYKTLDNEINAKISQTYTYLKNFNSLDENILKNKLDEYYIRKEYLDILSLDIKKIISDLSNNTQELYLLNNYFIDENVQDFFPFILKIDDIDVYINNWMKIIKNNAKKLIKKQDNIIKEVIEDLNYSTKYDISESTIMNYNEYIKENLKI